MMAFQIPVPIFYLQSISFLQIIPETWASQHVPTVNEQRTCELENPKRGWQQQTAMLFSLLNQLLHLKLKLWFTC